MISCLCCLSSVHENIFYHLTNKIKQGNTFRDDPGGMRIADKKDDDSEDAKGEYHHIGGALSRGSNCAVIDDFRLGKRSERSRGQCHS